MKKSRKSEFPQPPDKRKVTLFAGGMLVLAVGLITASLLGVNIPLPGLSHHAPDSDFEAHDFEATVTVTDQGFLPAVLKVKPKTRVYFENHTAANHKVDVSANTPDSDFGSLDQILPNSGYGFTFTQKGDYKFHDGDNPVANGEVIVE